MAAAGNQSAYSGRSARLTDIWRLLWSLRLPVLLVLLAFTVVFWGVALVYKGDDEAVYTWQSKIQFTFSGIDHGRYPDGTPFTSADLISPVVLERVHRELGLDEQGIGLAELSGSVAVAPYTPRRYDLIAQFDRRLGNNLSTAEIAELEEDFLARLQRITHGQVVLTLTTPLLEMPAGEILAAIPRIWADYVVEEYGAFAADLPLYSADVIDDSRALEMDFLLTYDALKETFRRLNDNLEWLEEQPNSGQVEDPETGLRLSDVRALSGELEEFVLENAISPSLAFGLSNRPDLTVWFFENRVQSLQRRKSLMEARAERVGRVLDDYLQQQTGAAAPGFPSTPGSQGASALNGGFLQRLIQLGASRGDTGFRQELSRQRLDYTLEAAEIQAEIRRVTELVELIETQEGPAVEQLDLQGEPVDSQTDSLQKQIREMIAEVRKLYEVTGRIAERMNMLRFGGQGPIYNVVNTTDSPTSSALVLHEANMARYLLGLMIVALAATLGLALLSVLVRGARSRGD